MNAPVIHPTTADTVPSSEGTTPVMAQFLAAKASQPDAIVFFRMGDFYELFFKDAEIASRALGITLTKRGKHQGQDIPMAGVPVHALDGYLARLIRQGFKAAICEQMEAPSEARKRDFSVLRFVRHTGACGHRVGSAQLQAFGLQITVCSNARANLLQASAARNHQ